MASVTLVDNGPGLVPAGDAAPGVYVNGAGQMALISMVSSVKQLTYVSAAGAVTTVPAASSGQSVRVLASDEEIQITNP